jgi:thiamine pyrophosphokinase
MKKAILIGAGPIGDVSFLKKASDCYMVASDGGYRAYERCGVVPDLFVGDYDTMKDSKKVHARQIISLDVVKDDTDTIFALKHCLESGYDTFYLYGCLGGKIEHTIANIQTLSFLLDHHAMGYLISEDGGQVVFMVNQSVTFKPDAKGILSVFSHTNESKGVSMYNLMYTLEDATLTSSFPLGVSNQFINGRQGRITVGDGRLVVVTDTKNVDEDFPSERDTIRN